MLTPAYSPTATERVLPRLALDFITASLDPRVTVARALNTATRVNASGLVETVNADLPRFDFNPVTLTCRGLLIEETRENLCAYSAAVGGTGWTLESGVTVSGTTTAPDGSSANTISCTNASSGVYKQISSLGAATYTVSFYAKAGTSTSIAVGLVNVGYFVAVNLTTGAILGGIGASRTTVANAGNNWWRVSVYNVCSAGNFGPLIVSNTANTTFSVWGAQFEIGEFATSYIPTTTTSLTRNADVVSMTGTNFSDWYSSSSAALAAVVIPNIATGTRPIWQLDDTTANEIIALRGNVANPELYIVDGGTPQAQLDAGTITAGTQYGLCAAFAANSCAVSQNGAAPATTATATMPTVTQARIGSDGSNFLNGAVRTLRYWPQRILNAETQAFSK